MAVLIVVLTCSDSSLIPAVFVVAANCMRLRCHYEQCWLVVRIVRNRTRSGNLLVSFPAHNFGPDECRWISTIVGSDIYANHEPSTRVFIMDCRFHTWHEAPSMLVAKKNPLVSVFDGKIFVVGRITYRDFSNFLESFDPETKMWACANPYSRIQDAFAGIMEKLPKLPKPYYGSLRLENCGGKIVLLWVQNVCSICSTKEEKRIWCAEIALEKRSIQEICGKVKWCDVVLTVPKSCPLEQLFVATI
ncbi:putative F-box/kelch-repeat protein At4g11770 [Brassica napus]|uniref:putative F-box/kelch-repeat protein At4g11770 n=1 Tax=Brassica napus TaxID=3708 RepID=UPI0020786D63|nr:putative F-box/kelch-repeat protein At4g11770 [Brassica napus]